MSVTVRTSQTNSALSSGTSLVITKPTGLAVGDLMVAIIAVGTAGGINVPANWTALAAEQAFSSDKAARVLYKKADAGDVAASNFTFTFTANSWRLGALMAFAGVNSTVDNFSVGTDSDGTPSSTGFTPSQQDFFLILSSTFSNNDNAVSISTAGYAIATDNPSWTEIVDFSTSSSGVKAMSLAVAYASRAQLTATGAATNTATPSAGGFEGSVIYLLGLVETVITTLDVAVIASSAPDPVATGGTTVTLDVISVQASAPDFAYADQAKWSSQQKGSAPIWTPLNKSP